MAGAVEEAGWGRDTALPLYWPTWMPPGDSVGNALLGAQRRAAGCPAWFNARVTRSSPDQGSAPLRHVVVVAGRPAEWVAFSDLQWSERLAELGKVADHAGVGWLGVRPFGPDTGPDTGGLARPSGRSVTVGQCLVTTDTEVDGRHRLLAAVQSLREHHIPITDVAIGSAINAPAHSDPDLVVVFAGGHALPPSLVWELAYAELVFIDATWHDLGAAHLAEAIATYSHRHRRFGGLD